MENEILIDGVFVPIEILTAKFRCDFSLCGGGCCNADDKECEGAPLTQEEATRIRKYRSVLAVNVDSSRRRGLALTKPVYTYRRRLPFRVQLYGKRCIYCNESGCSLKMVNKRFPELPTQPISCALYPICEGWDYYERKPYLYVEHYFDDRFCKYAYSYGKETGTWLIDFCKDAIVRRFGEDFFVHLKEAQQNVIA